MTMQVNGAQVSFSEATVEELVGHHNEMLLTAVDFGLAGNPVTEFKSVAEGVAACERLHASIEKARERAAAPPKRERAKAKSKAKKAADNRVADMAKQAGAVVAGYTEPAKEKTVAKKTKKAKTAKKAKTNGAPRKTNGKLPLDAVITWVAEGNPARKGTVWFDRSEKVRKASGKTVEAAIKAGAPKGDINIAISKGLVKTKGGSKAAAAA